MKYLLLLGRVLYSWIFISSAFGHFSPQEAAFAASKGVPMASVLVPLSGVLALLGGLSILFGYKARIGAWLIVLFLVPVTLVMHNYWTISDPMQHMMQLANFNKNMALTGAALWIVYFGAGQLSVDAWLSSRKKTGPVVQGFSNIQAGKHALQH